MTGHAAGAAHRSRIAAARTPGCFNLVAFLAIIAVTIVLVIGIKESANFNTAIVIVKVAIVLMFIGVAGLLRFCSHPAIFWPNWHPFIPPNTGNVRAVRLVGNCARGGGNFLRLYRI